MYLNVQIQAKRLVQDQAKRLKDGKTCACILNLQVHNFLKSLFKKSPNDKYGLMLALQEGYCKTKSLKTGAKIHSYRRVKRYNREALKKALAYHGPTTISINANPKTLKFYSHGVLDDITCSK